MLTDRSGAAAGAVVGADEAEAAVYASRAVSQEHGTRRRMNRPARHLVPASRNSIAAGAAASNPTAIFHAAFAGVHTADTPRCNACNTP